MKQFDISKFEFESENEFFDYFAGELNIALADNYFSVCADDKNSNDEFCIDIEKLIPNCFYYYGRIIDAAKEYATSDSGVDIDKFYWFMKEAEDAKVWQIDVDYNIQNTVILVSYMFSSIIGKLKRHYGDSINYYANIYGQGARYTMGEMAEVLKSDVFGSKTLEAFAEIFEIITEIVESLAE